MDTQKGKKVTPKLTSFSLPLGIPFNIFILSSMIDGWSLKHLLCPPHRNLNHVLRSVVWIWKYLQCEAGREGGHWLFNTRRETQTPVWGSTACGRGASIYILGATTVQWVCLRQPHRPLTLCMVDKAHCVLQPTASSLRSNKKQTLGLFFSGRNSRLSKLKWFLEAMGLEIHGFYSLVSFTPHLKGSLCLQFQKELKCLFFPPLFTFRHRHQHNPGCPF